MTALAQFRDWYWGDPERHRIGRLDLERARREVVAGTFDLMGIAAPSAADEIADAYSVQRELAVKPFPGATETVSNAQARGIKTALITNGC